MADERKLNSFQRLMEEEYESKFTLPKMMEVEKKIHRQHNTQRVTGDMIDLFFPKIIKTVISMLGGESDYENESTAPSSISHHYKPSSPKAPGER